MNSDKFRNIYICTCTYSTVIKSASVSDHLFLIFTLKLKMYSRQWSPRWDCGFTLFL